MLNLQVAILEIADPKGPLTVVEGEHGLHSVHKQLQTLLQGRNVIGQTCVLVNLSGVENTNIHFGHYFFSI